MASSSSTIASSPFAGVNITEKLAKGNFVLWQAQVLPAIKGAQLEGFIDGTIVVPPRKIVVQKGGKETETSNPGYGPWVAQDQQVLSFLITSLSREVMPHVAIVKTSEEAWNTIQELYAAKSGANTVNMCIALANAEKANKTMAEYIAALKFLEERHDRRRQAT